MSKRLFDKADYQGAIKENFRILFLSGQGPPGDEALFNIGLIYAHNDNPNKDFTKSRLFFRELIKEYPQSTLSEEAKIWIGKLNGLEKTDMKENQQEADLSNIMDIQKTLTNEPELNINDIMDAYEHVVKSQLFLKKRKFKRALSENQKAIKLIDNVSPGDEALFNIGLIYAHSENPDKDYKKSIIFFRKLIKKYPQSTLSEQAKIWIGVLDVIEKSKQIDIEIEQKKQLTR
jgi:TolA-binding protein